MKKIVFLSVIIMLAWGCTALSQNYRLGTQAALNQDWDEAIAYYERAALENPKNPYYRIALVRARISASNMHLRRARALVTQGKREEALAEYDKAIGYDPDNRLLLREARRLLESKDKPPAQETHKIEPPVKLRVSQEPLTLKFPTEIPLRSIFEALGKYGGVNLIFDAGFRDRPFAIDLTNMTFEQALNTICVATQNFYLAIDEMTVLILPDLQQNRLKYNLTAMKTWYLANVSAQEVQQWLMQMLRSQFVVPSITHNKDLNSVTIKASADRLELADRIIRAWDKPKGEVVIEMELMEVRRQKLRDMGLDFDSHTLGILHTGNPEAEASDTGYLNLTDVDLTKKGYYQVSLPAAFLRFLETDVDTKFIAQPRLRGLHGEKIEYMVGDEVPIPQTTFQPFAAGGINQTPVTQFQYKNVGIEIIMTPTVHSAEDVTLELDLKIKALGGAGFGDLPIISSRQVKNVMRLKDGETNMLAGLLKDEERQTLKGIAGIVNLPVLGRLFSKTDQEIQQTDVIMVITPYIIRSIPLESEDSEALWLPLEGISTAAQPPPGRRLNPDGLYLPQEEEMEQPAEEQDAQANRIELSPPGYETRVGREYRVNVNLRTQAELQNISLTLSYDAQVLRLKSINRGNVVQRMGENPSFLENIDNSSGTCVIGVTSPEVGKGFQGRGNIVTLIFDAYAQGESSVSVSSFNAISTDGQPVQFVTRPSQVRVR